MDVKIALIESFTKNCTLSNHRGLRSMTERHMYASLRKKNMDSARCPELSMLGLNIICKA